MEIQPTTQTPLCRSCGAAIIFLPTKAGKKMPIDFETVEAGDVVFDAKKHRSHFVTCPNAVKHRKPK